jgi:hypothetical protein
MAPKKLGTAAMFKIADKTGTKVTSCKDPMAQNYNSACAHGTTCCTYATCTANCLTTGTQFTLFPSEDQPTGSAYLFLNWAGPKTSAGEHTLAAGTQTIPIQGGAQYLFSFSMEKCPFTLQRAGGQSGTPVQIYYGDYVQLTVTDTAGDLLYFNPKAGGDNAFTSSPGDCTAATYQTFQIVKVDTTDKTFGVAKNAAVSMYDTIALIAVSNQGGSAQGQVIQIGANKTSAGVTTKGCGSSCGVQNQHGAETKRMPLSHIDFAREYKKTKPDDCMSTIGWVLLTILILILLF